MLLAGISLACWAMLRVVLKRKKKAIEFARDGKAKPPVAASRLGGKGNAISPTSRTLPFGDAPPELQRWQVAMFDLARELKADVDTRVMTLAQLSKRVEGQIQHLENLLGQIDAGSPQGMADDFRFDGNRSGQFTATTEALQSAAATPDRPTREAFERPGGLDAIDLSVIQAISDLTEQGSTVSELAEQFALSEDDVEFVLARQRA